MSEYLLLSFFPDTPLLELELSANISNIGTPVIHGQLRQHWSKWEKLNPNHLVSSIIRNGYILKWIQDKPPPAMWHRNNPTVYEHPELVTSQLKAVLALGAIEECQRTDLHCILALNLLPKPNNEKRLILNGHPLKQFELPRHFKMEHLWAEGRSLFAGCTHGSVIDISSAFYLEKLKPPILNLAI